MTETKPIEPNSIPEPDNSAKQPSVEAIDPSQAKLLAPIAATSGQMPETSPVIDSADASVLAAASGPAFSIRGWFKKLSQTQIIWISFLILMVFFIVFFLLIMQGRQKNKTIKSLAGKQLDEISEIGKIDTNGALKNKLARQAAKSSLLLTDDEFAGRAPNVVRASGPLISAAVDPELAALVDALKIRLKVSGDSKSTSRGNIVTTVSKGDYRGFKISVDEKTENQNLLAEEITVTTPQKGFIQTKNGVLESIKGSDLARFSAELQNAGLEIIKLPLQPGNKTFHIQFKAVSIFGKPIANDLLISGKGVGKISLGMPTAQLENMLLSSYIVLKRKVLVNDIYYDVYKVLDQSNEPLFFVYENKGRVWGISIISDIFKTEKGIGIGSSLGNIRINYPRINMGISEKKIPYVKINGVDGLFVIQSEGIDVLKQIFPSKTKITSILIGNSLEFE